MWIRPTGETTKKKRTMLFTSRWCGNSNNEANFYWKIQKIFFKYSRKPGNILGY